MQLASFEVRWARVIGRALLPPGLLDGTVDDVVRRRTTLQVRGLDTREVRERIAATLAEKGVLMPPDER